jgi:hypothetical protein
MISDEFKLGPVQIKKRNLVEENPNSYINNSSVVKTAAHKRRNISIGIDRAGLDTAEMNMQRSHKMHDRNKKTNNPNSLLDDQSKAKQPIKISDMRNVSVQDQWNTNQSE